jgi:transcriptional regulator with XRE-family HTH domain
LSGTSDPTSRDAWEQEEQDIRARLRGLRLHLGLTQHESAERLGCSLRAYRYNERQCSHRRVQFLLRVAREFNVSLDWLVTGTKLWLPRNDRKPIDPDMKAIPPRLREVAH